VKSRVHRQQPEARACFRAVWSIAAGSSFWSVLFSGTLMLDERAILEVPEAGHDDNRKGEQDAGNDRTRQVASTRATSNTIAAVTLVQHSRRGAKSAAADV
jgi:hypothetical protein